jgi:hypothetical protein
MYALTSGQPGVSTFSGWTQLAKIDDRVYHSPYINLKKSIGDLEVMAGVRYSLRVNPKTTFYKTAGLPDVRDLENTKLPFIMFSYSKGGGSAYENINSGSQWGITRTDRLDFAFG